VESGGEGGEPILAAGFEQDACHRVLLIGHRVSPGRRAASCCLPRQLTRSHKPRRLLAYNLDG